MVFPICSHDSFGWNFSSIKAAAALHCLYPLPVLYMLTLMYAICVAGFESFTDLWRWKGTLPRLCSCSHRHQGNRPSIVVWALFLSARWTFKFYMRLLQVYKNKRARRRIRRFKHYLVMISAFTVVWYVSSTLDSWDPYNPIISITLSAEVTYALAFLEYLMEACVIFSFFAMQIPAELVTSLIVCGLCRSCKTATWDRIPSSRITLAPLSRFAKGKEEEEEASAEGFCYS